MPHAWRTRLGDASGGVDALGGTLCQRPVLPDHDLGQEDAGVAQRAAEPTAAVDRDEDLLTAKSAQNARTPCSRSRAPSFSMPSRCQMALTGRVCHAASSTAAARVDSASTARGVLRALTPWRGHARSMVSLPSLLLRRLPLCWPRRRCPPPPRPSRRPEGPGHPGGTLAVGGLHARDVDEGSGTLDGVLPRPRLPSSRQGTIGPGTGRQSAAPGALGPTGPAAGPPARSEVRGGWAWPLSPVPRVVRRFTAPTSAWGRGHRGVDLAGSAAQQVRAAAPRAGHACRRRGGTAHALGPARLGRADDL